MTSILIVEDDQMLGRAVHRNLTEEGFAVQIASGVVPALDVIKSTPIDVLLTDLRLGTPDGIDLLERVRELSPRTRSVLMSGFASARDYERAVAFGAVRVLSKPFTHAELIQCIRTALDCETGFHGSIHGVSLLDLLQMFNQSRRSVVVDVSGPSSARMFLRDGQFIHAEHQGKTGEAALASILALPTGSLSTSVVPELVEHSIQRDFRAVLLDALSSVDDATSDRELDLDASIFALGASAELAPVAPALPPPVKVATGSESRTTSVAEALAPRARQILERVASIDGHLGAAFVLSQTGEVLARDGRTDLRPAAMLVAGIVREAQKTIAALGILDVAEDILITTASQCHILRILDLATPAFIHLVLDRQVASPAMAKLELASAVRAFEL